MLDAIAKSSGTAISVSDEELMIGTEEVCRYQGIAACPEGGAVWKAAEKLLDDGWLKSDERIVLFNTGTGLKYNHLYNLDGIPRIDQHDENWLAMIEE